MILIKDRHECKFFNICFHDFGKYDTYKGSTLVNVNAFVFIIVDEGNMILIKDRHHTS